MHPIDRLAPLAFALTRRKKAFSSGWGDADGLAMLGDTSAVKGATRPEVVWSRKEEHRGYRRRQGHFTSALAPTLPEAARVVSFDLIEPARGSRRLSIQLPAWNDHGAATRMKMAQRLVDRSVASVIFDAPFLGSRRIHGQQSPPVATVADFGRMGAGTVVDALSLASLFADSHQVGVTGYSMGGNLAAMAAALSPAPLSVAPLAASYSPEPVFCDAVLRRTVDWAALDEEGGIQRLRTALAATSVLAIDPPSRSNTAVFVAAKGDGFVPVELTRALADHWGTDDVRVLDGGHATLLWRQRDGMADAIVDAFDRFEAAT